MIEERIKKGIYAHLPELLEYVKAGAIERAMGTNASYISNRLHHHPNSKTTVRRFKAADVERVNQGLWQIGRRLLGVTIPYNDDRQQVIITLKEQLKDVFLKTLITNKLGWSHSKLKNHTVMQRASQIVSTFTPDNLEQITLAARELGIRLLSTELYLDE